MGCIIVKRNEKMEVIPEREFPKEKREEHLHRFIENAPQFVAPVDEETGEPIPIVVVASHLKLPSGDELDLLLLDSEGTFTLCELKRETVDRKTIGQILDYTAQLAEMGMENLKEQVNRACEELRKQVEQLGREWDEESFTEDALKEKLSRPRLVLVGWEVEEDAIRIARWLQYQGIDMECYKFNYFTTKDLEIFVPHNLTPYGEEERGVQVPLERENKRRKFWEDMLRRLGNRIPHRWRTPPKDPWLSFGVGIGGAGIGFYGSRSRLHVGFSLYKPRLKNLVERVKNPEFRKELEKETGETWQIHEAEKEFVLRTGRDTGGVSVWDAPEEVRDWGVETLVKLYNFIVPRIREWMGREEE